MRRPNTYLLIATLAIGAACKKSGGMDSTAEASPAKAPAASVPADLKGIPVDLTGVGDSDRAAFAKLLGKLPSPCGKAHSLEVSLRTDPSCKRSVFGARFALKLVKDQFLPSEVEDKYQERFLAPRLTIDTSAAPLRGDAKAPVTIVEFSDFQCPFCKRIQSTLEPLLQEYRGQVKLYFKNFPLSMHPYSATTAAAAIAAGKQGKFWQFHDKVFGGDQEQEAMADLERYAGEIKLDIPKWKADIEPSRAQVNKDRTDGEALNIRSTPTLYINGRHFTGTPNLEELKDWIDEELNK
jgi:protein-disulfide isomerase